LLPSVFQGIQGIFQKNQASDLKESQYVPPELTMNRDLAQQQAYSRRAPGQSQAESLALRAQANQLSSAKRSFGADANKIAAVSSGATAQTNDQIARIAGQGQQFSENAFGRLGQANSAIADQKRQNRMQFLQAKNALNQAGDQNLFNAVSNVASAGVTSLANGDWQGIDPTIKSQANEKIAMGKQLNAQTPNNGGMPYIKEGRLMKQTARRALRQNASPGPAGLWNNGYDPMAMYPGGYGPGWNMPGMGRGYVRANAYGNR